MATQTAQHRRELAAEAFDAYLARCPSRRLLDRIGDKWVSLVICALGEQPMRYSQLRDRIAAVSQKMLTQTLRNLERDGLVRRSVTPSVPVRVDYALTDLGLSLLEPIEHLKRWAEQHMPAVDAARARYDDAALS
ncbi:winged helix-turn-helix transcriptional regulator [Nakamurella aerolata]|uniref:Helix-turn-helix transcriptional regulator n=1 Tax=Nakamurella aerolata TaxID=1656892 RepID=A0A849A228_9ACTN|nr:helix-turn-helix domain-containing protein [Nakamurella aerolata]NNG35094.1 helix-turn-helix transcriptional regulator [Nakamurella aerolata]